MMFLRLIGTKDRSVFFLCSVLGLIVSLSFRPALWAPYAGALLAFHLFLAYQLLLDDKKTQPSYNYFLIAIGHLCFVALVVVTRLGMTSALLNWLSSQPREAAYVSYRLGMRVIRIAEILVSYGLCLYERDWLFGGQAKHEKSLAEKEAETYAMAPVIAMAPVDPGVPLVAATGEDHYEWIQSRTKNSSSRFPNVTSPKDDFEQWLRARGKTQYPLTQGKTETVAG
jgi:hypothetical protein